MKRLLFVLAFLLPTATAQRAQDLNLTYSAQAAAGQVVALPAGAGSLITLNFPENVTDVTTTRAGLVESKIAGRRVILAGVSNTGSTPLLITTETRTYTWRLSMSEAQSGSIVNVNVTSAGY